MATVKFIGFFKQLTSVTPYNFYIEIYEDIDELDKLWDLEDDDSLFQLRIFLSKFNKKWRNTSNDVFFYISVYATPMEIADYLINAYEEAEMEDLFEKDIEYTKEEFLSIVNNVYGNKFLEKRFIDILNNNLPMLV